MLSARDTGFTGIGGISRFNIAGEGNVINLPVGFHLRGGIRSPARDQSRAIRSGSDGKHILEQFAVILGIIRVRRFRVFILAIVSLPFTKYRRTEKPASDLVFADGGTVCG